jgi:pimeloyl-ACP methyl ester carboxylesterase
MKKGGYKLKKSKVGKSDDVQKKNKVHRSVYPKRAQEPQKRYPKLWSLGVKKVVSKKSKAAIKKGKKVVKKKKWLGITKGWWGVILLVLLVLSIYGGTNFYLFYQYILGNDVIVNLNLENKDLFLTHGESREIDIRSSIVMNPFCSVECDYVFSDLSHGGEIDSGNFVMKSVSPFLKVYLLDAPLLGRGQKLFRFDIQCKGLESTLCYTYERANRKSVIISLNYDLTDSEKVLEEALIREFEEVSSKNNLIYSNLVFLKNYSNVSSIDFDYLNGSVNDLMDESNLLSESLDSFEKEWGSTNLGYLDGIMNSINDDLVENENETGNLILKYEEDITTYNELIVRGIELRYFIQEIKAYNLNGEEFLRVNDLINDYNLYVLNFTNKALVVNKENEFNLIRDKFVLINNSFSRNELFRVNFTLTSVKDVLLMSFENISLELLNYSEGDVLNEVSSECCVFGECEKCCGDECYSSETNYPVIFLHGHDFSSVVSPEYNLNMLSELQRSLEDDGYLDFGSFLVNVPDYNLSGIWGKTNYPISVRGSYYFDTILEGEDINILQTKKDNIDTYAIRLREVVDTVLQKTNREKVVLVTHSMGGLVSRRYMQIFGEEKVSKIVFIAAPHHGVSDSVAKFCDFFGSDAECNDLVQGSLLLNKLENYGALGIESHNIIGVGCEMNGETGDGVVKNSSAYLDWSKNYYFNGTCGAIETLHNDMMVEKKYGEVFEILKEIMVG